MKRFALAISAAIVSLALAGCGGGSSSPPSPFPFAGNWVQSPASGPVGTSLAIDSSGHVTGTLTPTPGGPTLGTPDPADEINGGVTGAISSSGATGLSRTDGGMVYSASGTLAVDGRGHLVGTLQETAAPAPGPPGTPIAPIVHLLGSIQLDMTKSL